MTGLVRLPHRALLAIRGTDRLPFLQGLITNDVRLLEHQKAIAAFILNTKGRIIEDILLYQLDDNILVECSLSGRSDLKKTLEKYRLRKKAEIVELDENVAFSTSRGDFADPRYSKFGFRIYGKDGSDEVNKYHQHRCENGVAEGPEETQGLLPFQANGDLLNHISLDKGCYIGQELTARTAHTGVIRRRILPFHCKTSFALSEPVTSDGKKVGQVISHKDGVGLALLSLSAYCKTLTIGEVPIKAFRPPWMPESILAVKPDA